MPRLCTICRHPDRDSIETQFVGGSSSMRVLAGRVKVSPSSLRRHLTNHLPAMLADTRQAEQLLHASTLAEHVRELYKRSGTILRNAEIAGDARTALAAVRELRSILDLVARLTAKDSARIDVAAVQAFVEGVFELIDELVPPDRAPEAIGRLHALASNTTDEQIGATSGTNEASSDDARGHDE